MIGLDLQISVMVSWVVPRSVKLSLFQIIREENDWFGFTDLRTWSVGSSPDPSNWPPVTRKVRGRLAALAPIRGLGRGVPDVWGEGKGSLLVLFIGFLRVPKSWR